MPVVSSAFLKFLSQRGKDAYWPEEGELGFQRTGHPRDDTIGYEQNVAGGIAVEIKVGVVFCSNVVLPLDSLVLAGFQPEGIAEYLLYGFSPGSLVLTY